jgi:tetratricopeptide (TPR) repeat protein
VESSWVKFEVEQAMTTEVEGKKLKVLPVLLEKCEVPLSLRHKCYANFSDPRAYDDEFLKLVNSIKPGIHTSIDMPIGASRARLLLGNRLKKRYQELLAIARNFHEQHDSYGAEKVLREAIDLVPYAAGAYVTLGLIFACEGKQSQAKQCWAEALKRNPNSESALFNLGVFHMNNSNFREAKNYFQRVIDQNGEYVERARGLLKSLRAYKGKWIT